MFTTHGIRQGDGDRGYQTSAIGLDSKATTTPEQQDAARAYVSRLFADTPAIRDSVLDALGLG